MPLFSSKKTIRVSLRISHSDVTVLKFDQNTSKILSLFQQPLAKGIVTSGTIAAPEKLQAAVKSALSQAQALGSEVIIGFPEDKTFTTTLNIPDIPEEDKNQAVYWQAEEVIPAKLESLYFDWKEIPLSKTTHKQNLSSARPLNQNILLVSVPKTLLDPIINAVVKSGSKPLSCEPTSLSLARLAPLGEIAAIAEVRKLNSTIIVIDQQRVVRLSLVVADPGKIASELKRMTAFYQSKYQMEVTKLYVCGEGATSQWQKYLASQTNLQVIPTPLEKVKNPPEQILNFAVAVSLVNKDPSPPKSSRTINLLPETLEAAYEQAAEKQSLSFGLKAALFTTLITAGIMFAGFVMLQLQISRTNSQIETLEQATSQTSYAQDAKNAETANALARTLNRLPPKDSMPALLADFHSTTTPGISITSYTLDLPERVLLVNGLAQTRNDLLQYKADLESQASFSLVTIPLPTLERQTDIQFSLAVDISLPKK